jgi:hypothetical protein
MGCPCCHQFPELSPEDERKLARYRSGENWVAPVPPVCTELWSELDWARYVTFTKEF